ncbi:MAG: UvrD-helicase domain-containing protein [Lentisphaeria bacterium]|nr:UvrD-helicase domain-containing protein [Lentisphaeria bacterium]
MLTKEEIINSLNPEQGEAAKTLHGPVLVLAGAGTGKTRVITYRIAYMLASGIMGEEILGLTFTNKAANEMRERLSDLVGADLAKKVTLGTFHSFCISVLRKEISKLGYLPTFTIADASDQQGLFKQAAAEIGHNKLIDDNLSLLSNRISLWKNQLWSVEDAQNYALNDFDAMAAKLYQSYQNLLEMQNMVDFDDMIMLVYRIFSEKPEVLEHYQNRFRYLLVDEYQDTNAAQFRLVEMLAGKNCNLCVVGDDDQSIYGWRGADVGNILDFPKIFPGTKEIKLEQNYRSTNKILHAANAVIATNTNRHSKNLWSKLGDGENIKVVVTQNGEKEAEFIATMISQMMAENPKLTYSDFAILYRSNHLSRQLELGLRNVSIPYILVGGQEFFKRKEIKDAVAYLKVLINPYDNQNLLRILPTPPRGLAQKAVDKLKEMQNREHGSMLKFMGTEEFLGAVPKKGANEAANLVRVYREAKEYFAEPGNLAAKIKHFLTEVGYLNGLQAIYKDLEDAKNRRENVDEFINAVAQFEAKSEEAVTLAQYLESFALLEETDKNDDKSTQEGGVILSTVHASKGLEFPIVFLVALERNIFPHERSIEEGSLDEEMRLFYVAITRAKKELFITRAQERFIRGMKKISLPSPFLEKLPAKIVEKAKAEDLIKPLTEEAVDDAFAKIFQILND